MPRPEVFDSLDSTNLHARRLVESESHSPLPLPHLLVARTQTAGVGRFGRPWSSPRGGLWCTLIWPLATDRDLDALGLRVGIACLETIAAAAQRAGSNLTPSLKWPNDILLRGRKVCGSLCEVTGPAGRPPIRRILIGIGINANFPASALADAPLSRPATSLRDELGIDTDLDALQHDLASRLAHTLANPAATTPRALDLARRHLHGLNEPAAVTLPDNTLLHGTLTGLDDHGHAILHTAAGDRTIPAAIAIDRT